MKYDSPDLREQLAAEYVLGTMPVRVRRRFERLLTSDPGLRRAVEDWNARFGPIDRAAAAQEPPARIWRAVERRLALPSATAAIETPGWFGSLAFWRGATFAAAALAAAAIFYIAVSAPLTPTKVIAILSDDKGDLGWIALGGPHGDEIAVAPVHEVPVDTAHAFELWAISKGPPQPLGLLPSEPGQKLMVQASLVPAEGVLAVSVEPAGGSPTGLPTGPVRYKGNVLAREP
jgi:anti-sigma-K factor RskA